MRFDAMQPNGKAGLSKSPDYWFDPSHGKLGLGIAKSN